MEPAKLDTNEERPEEANLEVHPMVELLLARMENHPQEFYRYSPNQSARSTTPNTLGFSLAINQTIEHTKNLWNRKEKRLYNLALRKVRMEEAHHRLMKMFLTGEAK